MGKQTAVVMTKEDEKEFISFLKSIADVEVFRTWGDTEDDLRVTDMTSEDGFQFYIWNKAFPYKNKFRLRNDNGKNFYQLNTSTSPLIEYLRQNFDNERIIGRIYWSKYFSAVDPLEYDVDEFDKWYSKIIRWIRKFGKKLDGPQLSLLRAYYLPDAWDKYGKK